MTKNIFAFQRLCHWVTGTIMGMCLAASASATLTPLYTASAGPVSQVAAAPLGQYVLTAVRTSSGFLEVISWQDTGTALVRKSSVTGGAVSAVSIAGGSVDFGDTWATMTAVINSAGNLELTVWTIDANGILTTKADMVTTSVATSVAICNLNSVTGWEFATAIRESNGNLGVNHWVVSYSNINVIKDAGSASAGAVTEVSVDSSYLPTQFLTAVRNGSGSLEVIAWNWSANAVTRQGSFTAGPASQVAVAQLIGHSELNVFTTLVEDGSGNFSMAWWGLDLSGTLAPGTTVPVLPVTQVSLCTYTEGEVFAAVIDGLGNLQVSRWNAIGREIDVYNTTSNITAVSVSISANSSMLTAARDLNGNLALQVWGVS